MTPLINLLPWHALQRQQRFRWRCGVAIFVVLILVGGFWGAWTLLSQKIMVLHHQGDELESQHQKLQETLRYQQGQLLGHEREQQGPITEQERRYRVSRWGDILTRLASQLPESSWLHSVNWQAGVVTLEGYTTDVGELATLEELLTQLPDRFHVQAGAVSYQPAQGLSYTFILEENGGELVLP